MLDWGRIQNWKGWRQYAPTAGSIASHGVILSALAVIMASSVKPPPPALLPPPRNLEVMLISETPPPPVRTPVTAPRTKAPEPKSDSVPIAPRTTRKEKPATTPAPEDEGVYIPPSIFADSNIPIGLRDAVQADPCKAKNGVKQRDCVTSWASKLGTIETLMPRSEDDLKRYYAEFMVTCPYNVGCGPNQARMVQLNGAQSTYALYGAPMMSGAGGLGGIHELVPRGRFDPDHRDPGFGD